MANGLAEGDGENRGVEDASAEASGGNGQHVTRNERKGNHPVKIAPMVQQWHFYLGGHQHLSNWT